MHPNERRSLEYVLVFYPFYPERHLQFKRGLQIPQQCAVLSICSGSQHTGFHICCTVSPGYCRGYACKSLNSCEGQRLPSFLQACERRSCQKAATHSCSLQYLVLVISCGVPFSFFKCSAHCWCAICHFWCSLSALGSQIPNYPEDPKDDKEKDIKACLPRTPRACAARWRGFLSCAQGFAGLPKAIPALSNNLSDPCRAFSCWHNGVGRGALACFLVRGWAPTRMWSIAPIICVGQHMDMFDQMPNSPPKGSSSVIT